jgi:hypothetical protein
LIYANIKAFLKHFGKIFYQNLYVKNAKKISYPQVIFSEKFDNKQALKTFNLF